MGGDGADIFLLMKGEKMEVAAGTEKMSVLPRSQVCPFLPTPALLFRSCTPLAGALRFRLKGHSTSIPFPCLGRDTPNCMPDAR